MAVTFLKHRNLGSRYIFCFHVFFSIWHMRKSLKGWWILCWTELSSTRMYLYTLTSSSGWSLYDCHHVTIYSSCTEMLLYCQTESFVRDAVRVLIICPPQCFPTKWRLTCHNPLSPISLWNIWIYAQSYLILQAFHE